MSILYLFKLLCNKNFFNFDFDGGNLSSDSGLLVVSEFMKKIRLYEKLVKHFDTPVTSRPRTHFDASIITQAIFQIICGYFTDDAADNLSKDPVFTYVLGKNRLASQPTMSRFYSSLDNSTLEKFESLHSELRKTIYSLQRRNTFIFDLDSTLCATYGSQENACYNTHYAADGYHPLVCYDAFTKDFIKVQLRKGSAYSSTGVAEFLAPILREYKENCPNADIMVRGDSGFAVPELYELCEKEDVKYVIRLKRNNVLADKIKNSGLLEEFERIDRTRKHKTAVHYGEMQYRAGSWDRPRRVVYKAERKSDELFYEFTFVVTNMKDGSAKHIINIYCQRGNMENFIKESKNGFALDHVSSSSMVVNANRMQIKMLAYNIINWMKRLLFEGKDSKMLIANIRTKLIKIASRFVRTGRKTLFRLCSSYKHKEFFLKVLGKIASLGT